MFLRSVERVLVSIALVFTCGACFSGSADFLEGNYKDILQQMKSTSNHRVRTQLELIAQSQALHLLNARMKSGEMRGPAAYKLIDMAFSSGQYDLVTALEARLSEKPDKPLSGQSARTAVLLAKSSFLKFISERKKGDSLQGYPI